MADYTFCETIAAYRWHIRKLDERGRMPGGISGVRTPALCGLEARWDIGTSVKESRSMFRDVCRSCEKAYAVAELEAE